MHFKLILVFVDDSKTDKVLEAARDVGATGVTIINNARGEGIMQKKTFLGLNLDSQRDVVLFLVEEHLSRTIIEEIARVGRFDEEPGSGIAIKIDVEDAIGVLHQAQEITMIDGKCTILEAVREMKKHQTSLLFVNKFHKNDEYGVINAGIIARSVLAKDRAPERVNVYEVNEKPLISVSPEMDIRYCSRLFARYDLMRAPVMENGQIIGVVSPIQLVLDGLCELSGYC